MDKLSIKQLEGKSELLFLAAMLIFNFLPYASAEFTLCFSRSFLLAASICNFSTVGR